jgi:hypothetical protein
MDQISLGIASYGEQPADWWEWLAWTTRSLVDDNIDLISIETARSMNTASNRNIIVKDFLKKKSEWLFWIDTDNITPFGGIRRLLDDRKEIINGIYFQKDDKSLPVAYDILPTNRYTPIRDWSRGEIIPVAAAGLGATLVHRSVYEKIQEEFVVLQRHTGGHTTLHRDDIKGPIPTELDIKPPRMLHGVYRERLIQPTEKMEVFPHHILEFGRTEDMVFYENARRVGFVPYVDTSVEVGHLHWKLKTGADYRKVVRRELEPRMVEYMDVEKLTAEVSND